MSAFHPPWPLGNRHLQTIFATTGPRRLLRRRDWRDLEACAKEVVLDAGGGVRLGGLLSRHGDEDRDLATVLHGWEGSARSLYVRSAAGHLFRLGFDVFRLHLRDHGGTHALNREPFTCTRLDEAVRALSTAHRQFAPRRHFLIGFSLGGNFALRMGLRSATVGVPLSKIVAICPAVLPHATMEDLERGFFLYHRYFLHKWKRTLRRKLRAFPDLGFGPALRACRSLRSMNEHFVPRFTEFDKPMDYFMGYSIVGDALAGLTIPSHIVAAADDPVIDVRHFDEMKRPACLSLEISERGGHCGFIKNWRMESWIDQRIGECLLEP